MSEGLTTESAKLAVNTGTKAAPVWTAVVERGEIRDPKTGDTIDMTSFDDLGFRAFKPGLRQMEVTASGNYVPTDVGYQKLRDSWLDGALVDVRFGWRTSDPGVVPETFTGWRVDAIITSIGTGGSVGEKVELSLDLQASGKPAEVTF